MRLERLPDSAYCLNHKQRPAAYIDQDTGKVYCMECGGLLLKYNPPVPKELKTSTQEPKAPAGVLKKDESLKPPVDTKIPETKVILPPIKPVEVKTPIPPISLPTTSSSGAIPKTLDNKEKK